MVDRNSQVGVEIVLSAIQGSLEGYKSSMEQGMRDLKTDFQNGLKDLKDEFKTHVKEESQWQERMEGEFLRLTGLPAEVASVKARVVEHENVLQQAQGAVKATRFLWGLGGLSLGLFGWLASDVLGSHRDVRVGTSNDPRPEVTLLAPPPALPPQQLPVVGSAAPAGSKP